MSQIIPISPPAATTAIGSQQGQQKTAKVVPIQAKTVKMVASTKTTERKEVPEPSPVTHLKRLFKRTDIGEQILGKSNRSVVSKPSADLTEAYDLEAVNAIRKGDVENLRKLMEQGKDLNACNRFGESLIHMACRRSDVDVVKFLVHEAHVNLEVTDDFGRSPVHDACWTTIPNFDVMDLLIRNVSPETLLAEDVRGHTAFHYARKEHWTQWVEFLAEREELMLRRLSLVQVVG